MALAAIPTGADEKRKYDNTVVLYQSALTLLRELLNHTFLRAVYHTSSRQAQNEYKEIQGHSSLRIPFQGTRKCLPQ